MIYNLLRMILWLPLKIVMLFNSEKRRFIKKRMEQNFDFLKSEKDYIS